jgi:hypothetical protein
LKRRGGWRNGIEGWCARELTDLRKGEGTGGGICFVSFSEILMANFGIGSLQKGEGRKIINSLRLLRACAGVYIYNLGCNIKERWREMRVWSSKWVQRGWVGVEQELFDQMPEPGSLKPRLGLGSRLIIR